MDKDVRNICAFIGTCSLSFSLSLSVTHTHTHTHTGILLRCIKEQNTNVVLIRGICLFSSNCMSLESRDLVVSEIVLIALTSLIIVNAVSPSLCQVPWTKLFHERDSPQT